jgi:cation diffusion facilitator CzcD-associated flavoprotein CzcO
VEHLDVLVVGAGLSGIGAGHFLQSQCPWATYAIAEARDTLGGTWDLFRYPGIRSDSDMFTLGYSFRPWDGAKAIADGDSILRYIRDTAADEGIDTHIRYGLRVVAADWSSEDAQWRITAERVGTGETVQLTCGFLLSCTGYYRYDHGYRPTFPGSERFTGAIIHPQAWPADLDHRGKRVVIIGSGATAITLGPALAATAQVTMVQRTPSYVLSLGARDPLADLVRRRLPARWSGPLLRWLKALTSQAVYTLSQRRPALVKRLLRRQLERRLPPGYDIDTHFTPTYDPWDQRLCLSPDGELFDAIRAGTLEVVTDHIETFTEDGLRLASGAEVDADIIVTATGLELLFLGGIRLSVDGAAVDPATRLTYKGMMLQDVPNLAFAIGYTNASWTLRCDLICDYVARLLNRMRQVGMRQCTPTEVAGTRAVGPLLGLRSGYVLRAADRLPRQGSAFPWQVHQSYLRDYRAMKLGSLDDPALVLSHPARPSARTAAEEVAPV